MWTADFCWKKSPQSSDGSEGASILSSDDTDRIIFLKKGCMLLMPFLFPFSFPSCDVFIAWRTLVYSKTFVVSWTRALDAGMVHCGDVSFRWDWMEREWRVGDRALTYGLMEGMAAKVGSLLVWAKYSQPKMGWQ